MNTVTKRTKVEPDGWLKVQAPPELENQEVDVIIVPQRLPAAERVAAWQRLCEESQNLPTSRAFIDEVTIRVEPSTHPTFPRDPKDEIFIAAGLASDADYLITGDKDLLDEQPLVSTQILRPADFARLFAIA